MLSGQFLCLEFLPKRVWANDIIQISGHASLHIIWQFGLCLPWHTKVQGWMTIENWQPGVNSTTNSHHNKKTCFKKTMIHWCMCICIYIYNKSIHHAFPWKIHICRIKILQANQRPPPPCPQGWRWWKPIQPRKWPVTGSLLLWVRLSLLLLLLWLLFNRLNHHHHRHHHHHHCDHGQDQDDQDDEDDQDD